MGAKYTCHLDKDRTFYVLDTSVSGKISLIMDRNYTDNFAPTTMKWCKLGSNNSCNHNNLNQYIEHIEELWTNVDSVELPTANQIAHAVGNTTWDSANSGSSYFFFDSKTTAQTATSKGASNYAWLFDYTYNCESYGCNTTTLSNYGYWTASPYADHPYIAWYVSYDGHLDFILVDYGDSYGVRPVITISNL